MTPDEARSYLSQLSEHPTRHGDTAFLHPDFAVRMATAIQQARNEGIPVSLESGYRSDTQTGSRYDAGGNSSHGYGLAADITGLDGPNGKLTTRWGQIASANGLNNPYGINNTAEFNHWQLPAQPLEKTPQLLANLQHARATGDTSAMWNAYAPTGGTATAQGVDNRQIFFNALVQKAGLTPQQAVGVLWSLGGESRSNLDTSAYNPNDPGGSIGVLQWLGDRRAGLETVAQRERMPVTNPQLQADYMVGELTGNLPGAQLQPGVLDALKNAKTSEEAAHIWTAKMERPTVDNTDQRLANRAAVGSIDAQGNFVPGTAKAIASTAAPAAGANSQTPQSSPYIASPQAILASSLGSDLASISAPSSVSSLGGGVMDTPGQPAIRSMAAQTDFMPPTSPMPAQFAAGANLGSQLGMLAAQPNPSMLESGLTAPSITEGAPSMTGMLGDLGTTATPGSFDQRGGNQLSPNPYRRAMRLA